MTPMIYALPNDMVYCLPHTHVAKHTQAVLLLLPLLHLLDGVFLRPPHGGALVTVRQQSANQRPAHVARCTKHLHAGHQREAWATKMANPRSMTWTLADCAQTAGRRWQGASGSGDARQLLASIAELAWMAPVLMLFLEAGMWGACGANRSDGVERIQCRGSAAPLGGRTSIDVDAGSKKEKLSCEL